jgi:hypothetical protein
MKTTAVVLALFVVTALSAYFDARGFVYAAQSWKNGSLIASTALLSLVNFVGGVTLYILSIGFQQRLGVQSAAVQSIFWFGMTVMGIALMDGTIAQWTMTQRAVGVVVSAGIGWLLISTAH